MTQKVYRVEYAKTKGKGFYCYHGSNLLSLEGKALRQSVVDAHSDWSYRPCINDTTAYFNSEYLCGCKDLDALEFWFEGFFYKIINLPQDFEVVSYLAKKVAFDDDDLQLGFIPVEGTRRKVDKRTLQKYVISEEI